MEAFTTVENATSKPVFGSDGAASWQNWQSETMEAAKLEALTQLQGRNLPKFPTTRSEKKLGGWEVHREHHERNPLGYTNFHAKQSAEDELNKANPGKKRKLAKGEWAEGAHFKSTLALADIVERTWERCNVLGEGLKSFLPSERFVGKKPGFVFKHVADIGTGYYFDEFGWVPKASDPESRLGGEKEQATGEPTPSTTPAATKKKKKKKKKSSPATATVKNLGVPPPPTQSTPQPIPLPTSQADLDSISDISSADPQHQVQHAIKLAAARRRDGGWEKMADPTSNREYFFNKLTNDTKWSLDEEKTTGFATYNNNLSMASKVLHASKLPEGWEVLFDNNSQSNYYINRTTNITSWEVPS